MKDQFEKANGAAMKAAEVQREAANLLREAERKEDMQRSKAELKRLFPRDAAEPAFMLYKGEVPSWLLLAVDKRGLHHQWFRNPGVLRASESADWLIIARDLATIEKRIERLRKRGIKDIAEWAEKREEERQAQEVEGQAQDAAAAVEHANHTNRVAESSQLGEQWGVTGRYEFKSKSFSKNYGHDDNRLWLEIHRVEHIADQAAEMFAKFELGFLQGWLRFETQDAESLPARVSNRVDNQRKRMRQRERESNSEDSEDSEAEPEHHGEETESDDDDGDYNDPIEKDPKLFLLKSSEKPSEDMPKWSFRWRALNEGTGEIVGGSDDVVCRLTFRGTGGAQIKGKFQTTYGDFKFKGIKVKLGSELEPMRTVVHEWKNLEYNY